MSEPEDPGPPVPASPMRSIAWTERDLYAVIGELFVKNQMAEQEVGMLQVQLAMAQPVESKAEADKNADGIP